MTLRTMASALGNFKVESFSAFGKFFDPNFHEAVQQIEDDSVPDSWVTEEFQKGYHQDGRLVRPSMVVVAKGGMSRAEWEALHAPEQEEPEVNDKVVSESETTSESLEPETEAAMANEPENDSSDVTSGDSSEFRPQRMLKHQLKNRSMTPMIKRMTNLRKKRNPRPIDSFHELRLIV